MTGLSKPAVKRVLLLNPPGDRLYARDKFCTSVSKTNYYWPPVDLLALSGRLAKRFKVGVMDAIVERLGEDACLDRAKQGGYDAVIFLTCAASWRQDFAFAARLKEELGLHTIALGGLLLTRAEEALERFPFLDAVLFDFVGHDVAHYLAGELDQVTAMAFRRNGRVEIHPRAGAGSFSYPPPKHELFPIRRYSFPLARHRQYTAVLASLGCTHRCSFCVPGTLGMRVRDPANVMAELSHIRDLGIPEVLFQDHCFSAVREHTLALMDAMIRASLGLEWICQTRVDRVDDELLARMRRAGCRTIQFGVESADPQVLRRARKETTPQTVEQAFTLCRRNGISTSAFFILGLPGDTEGSILDTIGYATRLGCDTAVFSLPMPHVGTALGDEILAQDADRDEWLEYDDVSAPRHGGIALTPQRLLELRDLAYRRFYLRLRFMVGWMLRTRTLSQVVYGLMSLRAMFELPKDRR